MVTVDESTLSVANANNADNATNVTTNINGKAISSIFESNGTTVKNASNAALLSLADWTIITGKGFTPKDGVYETTIDIPQTVTSGLYEFWLEAINHDIYFGGLQLQGVFRYDADGSGYLGSLVYGAVTMGGLTAVLYETAFYNGNYKQITVQTTNTGSASILGTSVIHMRKIAN